MQTKYKNDRAQRRSLLPWLLIGFGIMLLLINSGLFSNFGHTVGSMGESVGEVGADFGEAMGNMGESVGEAGANFGEAMGNMGEKLGEAAGNFGAKFGSGFGNVMGRLWPLILIVIGLSFFFKSRRYSTRRPYRNQYDTSAPIKRKNEDDSLTDSNYDII